MDEVTAWAAYFPDSVIWLSPDCFEMTDERSREIPAGLDSM
jgi:hypothetical protein